MAGSFRGSDPPLKDVRTIYDVIAPRKGESFDLTLLDPLILGTDCHWVIDPATREGRSRLCEHFAGACRHCKTERTLWIGWIAVIDHGRRGRAILRVGRESGLALARRAAPHTGLAGLRLKVTRSATHNTGALVYEDSPLPRMVPLPKSHPIEPTICIVLGCASLPDFRFNAEDIGGIPV